MRKTEKPIHTMPSVIAVLNIPMNMTVLTNVSMASNTKDGKHTMTMTRASGSISVRIAGRIEHG